MRSVAMIVLLSSLIVNAIFAWSLRPYWTRRCDSGTVSMYRERGEPMWISCVKAP